MTLALIPGLGTVGPMELIILLSIILLVFGAKRIPELARGLGSGVREFKKGTSGASDKDKLDDEEKKGGELTAEASATGADGKDDTHAEERTVEERPAERAEQKR